MQNDSSLSLTINDRDHVQGVEQADITLLEYGDYECPDTRVARHVVRALQQEFGDRLRFVYRHFPLDEHPHSWHAALAAESAGAQGKFWVMHEMLFHNQMELDDQALIHYAQELELDARRLARELRDKAHAESVNANIESGQLNGVYETPTFFVNGRYAGGPSQLSMLREAILQISES